MIRAPANFLRAAPAPSNFLPAPATGEAASSTVSDASLRPAGEPMPGSTGTAARARERDADLGSSDQPKDPKQAPPRALDGDLTGAAAAEGVAAAAAVVGAGEAPVQVPGPPTRPAFAFPLALLVAAAVGRPAAELLAAALSAEAPALVGVARPCWLNSCTWVNAELSAPPIAAVSGTDCPSAVITIITGAA